MSDNLTTSSLLEVAKAWDRVMQATELMNLAWAGRKVWTRARLGEKMFSFWLAPTVATESSFSHRSRPVRVSSSCSTTAVCYSR